jgi:hypothetical protein
LAEWEQTHGKKKAKYALTSTGLLMEGLSFIIPDVSDESTFVSPHWRYCQYALLGLTCYKYTQFGFGNCEFRAPTIQANHHVRKDPDDGLFNIFQSRKMDADLSREFLLPV